METSAWVTQDECVEIALNWVTDPRLVEVWRITNQHTFLTPTQTETELDRIHKITVMFICCTGHMINLVCCWPSSHRWNHKPIFSAADYFFVLWQYFFLGLMRDKNYMYSQLDIIEVYIRLRFIWDSQSLITRNYIKYKRMKVYSHLLLKSPFFLQFKVVLLDCDVKAMCSLVNCKQSIFIEHWLYC